MLCPKKDLKMAGKLAPNFQPNTAIFAFEPLIHAIFVAVVGSLFEKPA